MIVDAHHHLWDLARPGLDWLDDAALTAIRREVTVDEANRVFGAADVGRSIVVEARSRLDETLDLLERAADPHRRPDAVIGWVDLEGDVPAQLALLGAAPGGDRLVGIRHQIQSETDPGWFTRPTVLAGIEAVGAAGLVFDLVVRADQLPACRTLAEALPEVDFVLDHLGKPPIASGALQPWADDLRAFAAQPNTAAKISGLVTEADHERWVVEDLAPFVDVALDAFGDRRLLYGSDWPVCELAASYEQVLDTARHLLPTGDATAVFGGNARAIYRLETP